MASPKPFCHINPFQRVQNMRHDCRLYTGDSSSNNVPAFVNLFHQWFPWNEFIDISFRPLLISTTLKMPSSNVSGWMNCRRTRPDSIGWDFSMDAVCCNNSLPTRMQCWWRYSKCGVSYRTLLGGNTSFSRLKFLYSSWRLEPDQVLLSPSLVFHITFSMSPN